KLERFEGIGFAGDTAGNVQAGDEEIAVGEKAIYGVVEIVEVRDNGGLRGAGPLGSKARRGRIVAVAENSAGGGDPFALELRRLKGQTFVMTAKDGAFAVGVNQDE